MKTTPEHNDRIVKMTVASVYQHYITKVEKKGNPPPERTLDYRNDLRLVSKH